MGIFFVCAVCLSRPIMQEEAPHRFQDASNLILPYNENFFPIIPASVVLYFAVIGGLWFVMRNRKPIEGPGMSRAIAIHNFILCGFSLICFSGQLYEAIHILRHHSPFQLYCGTFIDVEDIRMAQWCVSFYLSKYYELLDTVFLVLRKKQLTVLHLFHHSIVIPISWMAVHAGIYMGWITSFNNTAVHIIMYYYFAIYALGQRPWWKKYLTSLQILQFVIDMSSSIPFIVIYMMGIPCRGELYAWILANLTGVALLLLFMNFYRQTYNRPPPTKKTN